MAFQKYSPGKGMLGSPFVGLDNFRFLFDDHRFLLVLRNTLVMSVLSLVTHFFGAIGLALLLNEVRSTFFKRTIQTVTYIPHFVSMVVIANIVLTFLSPDGGFVNQLLQKIGLIDEPIYFMGKGEYFWIIHTLTGLWKEPGIMPTAIMLLILSIGSLINIGYESQFLLGNPLVIDYSEVLDLYALNKSIGDGQYSVGWRSAFLRASSVWRLSFRSIPWLKKRIRHGYFNGRVTFLH